MLLVASATFAILITFGVALFAALVGGGAIYATLDGKDRSSAADLLRHPLRTIFSEDAPDRDPDDVP